MLPEICLKPTWATGFFPRLSYWDGFTGFVGGFTCCLNDSSIGFLGLFGFGAGLYWIGADAGAVGIPFPLPVELPVPGTGRYCTVCAVGPMLAEDLDIEPTEPRFERGTFSSLSSWLSNGSSLKSASSSWLSRSRDGSRFRISSSGSSFTGLICGGGGAGPVGKLGRSDLIGAYEPGPVPIESSGPFGLIE